MPSGGVHRCALHGKAGSGCMVLWWETIVNLVIENISGGAELDLGARLNIYEVLGFAKWTTERDYQALSAVLFVELPMLRWPFCRAFDIGLQWGWPGSPQGCWVSLATTYLMWRATVVLPLVMTSEASPGITVCPRGQDCPHLRNNSALRQNTSSHQVHLCWLCLHFFPY